jgi:surface antigen
MKTLVAALLLVPALALGQDAAPQLQQDPRAAKFKDVERGFFIGFDAGYLTLTRTPTKDTAKFQVAGDSGGRAGGVLVGVIAGVDIGRHLSVGLFAQGGNERADANYGAFSILSAGVDVKWAFWNWRDRNDWERLFLFAHGRAGYLQSYPDGLFATGETVTQYGIGVEYFTKLRHFSLGAVLDAVTLPQRELAPAGFALYPTIRYTF